MTQKSHDHLASGSKRNVPKTKFTVCQGMVGFFYEALPNNFFEEQKLMNTGAREPLQENETNKVPIMKLSMKYGDPQTRLRKADARERGAAQLASTAAVFLEFDSTFGCAPGAPRAGLGSRGTLPVQYSNHLSLHVVCHQAAPCFWSVQCCWVVDAALRFDTRSMNNVTDIKIPHSKKNDVQYYTVVPANAE